jgi:hypothetical protein
MHARQTVWENVSTHKMLAIIITSTTTVIHNYAGKLPREA